MNRLTAQVKEKLSGLKLKAVLFDMDGVIFDSMPHHAKAWVKAFADEGIVFNEYEAYKREGMTGPATIQEMFVAQKGREASKEECDRIYAIKCKYFENEGPAEVMTGIREVLEFVRDAGLQIFIVTGSGQHCLFNKLDSLFPGIFTPERMVTAYDVKKGKPDPEPYLMALKKGGFSADETIVVENAPLGVTSAHAAGIFTVAVNTGILLPEDLLSKGADVLFDNMHEFRSSLPEMFSLGLKK